MHEVVAALPDDAGEAGEGAEVAVAGHAEVGDGGAVRLDAGGDRSRVGERHHPALDGQVAQQEAELLLGAADAEAGDDVQDPHRAPTTAGACAAGSGRSAGRRRSGCSRRLAASRQAVSFSPMWMRGRAYAPVYGPGSIAQA